MQRNAKTANRLPLIFRPKILLIMKMLILLLTVTCMHVSASGFSQSTVTLSVKNASLKSVITEIEKQTGYGFLYRENKFMEDSRVDLNIVDMPVGEVISQLFNKTGISYKISKRKLVIIQSFPETLDKVITGTITNESGEPLNGVSISVKGSTIGTITDERGMFSLNVPDGAVLVVSSVGYNVQEIAVNRRTNLQITLSALSTSMDDVVVIAYGKQKKATVTGAVASISTKEIKQSPAANLAVALTGRLPGLTAIQRSGEPGRDNTLLYIRGRATINGQSPLIMVDGVERDITFLDPNEVDNVTILKDASSTALYGVRGANGVILVTTRRGRSAIPQISLTSEYGVQGFTRIPSTINSYDWVVLKNQARQNDLPGSTPLYSDYAVERFKLQDQPYAYPNNNWIDILLKKWAPISRINLNLDGATEYVKYYVNVGYLNQQGQWKIDPETLKQYDPRAFLNRYSFRSNIDVNLNSKKTLKTFLNVAGYLEKVNGPWVEARFNANTATTEIVSRIMNKFPVTTPGPTTPDGNVLVNNDKNGESPWAQINRSGYRSENRTYVTSTWGMEYDLSQSVTKGLSALFKASFDNRSINTQVGKKYYQYWIQEVDPNLKNANGGDSITYKRIQTNFDNTQLATEVGSNYRSFVDLQFQINYQRRFNLHNVAGTVVYQQQSLIQPGEPLPYKVKGYASRLTYDYDSRYMAEFNMGYNGSEQFSPSNRYGFFPAFSAGWMVSNEKFFESVKNNIDVLKIRGSYGKVGNDKISNRRFIYLDDITTASGGYSSELDFGKRINELAFGNPGVQWEVAKKMNVGIEIGLFKQLNITFDVFTEKRNNILAYRTIALLNGIPSNLTPPYNLGAVDNKGYEIELTHQKVINNKISVLTKFNFNYADNKVKFLDELPNPADFAMRYYQTGYSLGQRRGYLIEGYFNSLQEIEQSGLTCVGAKPRPGDFRYKDVNKDNVIDEKDIVPIGYSDIPKYTWGAATNITYKNFDFSILFQGAFKVSSINTGIYETDDFREIHKDAWTAEKVASGATIRYPALSLGTSSSQQSNDFFIQDASFVRLKNMEIGYRIPAAVLNRIGLKGLRIYANGLNVITWDRLKFKDWDPELVNNSTYPLYKIFNAGLNVTF